MNKVTILILTLVILSSLIGCTQSLSADILKSDKQRITTVNTSQSDLSTLVNNNNNFAFDLYQILSKKDSNLFMAPFSISEALAMTYAGARGNTEQQMATALHFTLNNSSLHPAFNNLDTDLNNRGNGSKGKDDKGFRLNIVNATWGQKNYTFLPEYLDTLAQYYGAGIRLQDFITMPEESRITINKWVSNQTENKINDLIPQGLINPLTRLVLTNAIYFNASWQYPFTKEATTKGSFSTLDGKTINIDMMRQTRSFNYVEGSDYQAIELPYDGREISMIIILPKTGQFRNFEQATNYSQVDKITSSMVTKQINLSMPKFKFESSFNLKDQLSAMGMPDAFTQNADFSGMNGKKDLFIADVVHKTFVAIDEKGTEAAAATAVVMTTTSMPVSPTEMSVNKPYIFFIKDNKTGSILFLGQVLNPIV